MKSSDWPKGFPASQADWDRLIADVPGEDRPLTPEEEATWAQDAVFPGGGVDAFVAHRRDEPGRAPRKVATTIRLDPDVLEGLEPTGKGVGKRVLMKSCARGSRGSPRRASIRTGTTMSLILRWRKALVWQIWCQVGAP